MMLMASAMMVMSQETVTLTFTANTTDGSYHRFSEVCVTNVTRGWTETLHYPDTVLVLTNTTGLGKFDAMGVFLSSVYPNPFTDETCAILQIEKAGMACVQVFDVNGMTVIEKSVWLEQGSNRVKIVLEQPQVAFLVVTVPQGRQVSKLLHVGHGGHNSITFEGMKGNDSRDMMLTTEIGEFEPGDVMSYEAIWSINSLRVHSDVVSHELLSDEIITLMFPTPEGAIDGLFSVSETSKVHFSRGNLQYQASMGIWRFAENQWDYVGYSNNNISSTYDGWIDLFGWGTSGYHNIYDNFNVRYQPFSYGNTTINTECNTYGYGPSTNMYDLNLTGMSAEYDWGVHNAISNGGNQTGLWRTLTSEEWDYILNTRSASTINGTTNARFVKAKVNGEGGIVLFPDDFSSVPIYLPMPLQINNGGAPFDANSYSVEAWEVMESLGCVFLPNAGYRHVDSYGGVQYSNYNIGYYWSTTYYDSSQANNVYFSNSSLDPQVRNSRCQGFSVRLVQDAE